MSTDRASEFFGDDNVRDQFTQALATVNQLDPRRQFYLANCVFSEAAKLTYNLLKDAPPNDVDRGNRLAVADARALAHRIVTSGYAIGKARSGGQHAASDWPDLLAFVQRKCAARVGLPGHDGWERCFTHIVGRCQASVQPGQLAETRDDAYAVLRHFASFFSGDHGFQRSWLIDVPNIG